MAENWNDGAPPEPGIYNASTEGNPRMLREWNGATWSAPWWQGDPAAIVERARSILAEDPAAVRWRHADE